MNVILCNDCLAVNQDMQKVCLEKALKSEAEIPKTFPTELQHHPLFNTVLSQPETRPKILSADPKGVVTKEQNQNKEIG